MKNLKGFALLITLLSCSVFAETDNFNVSLTGTFDNTIPDDCSITPIGTINFGTLNMHDILANADTELYMGDTTYDSGVTVNIIINCSNSTNYELTLDSTSHYDFATDVAFYLHDGASFLGTIPDGNELSGTGTGTNQTYSYKIFFQGVLDPDITNINTAFSVIIPATLTAW